MPVLIVSLSCHAIFSSPKHSLVFLRRGKGFYVYFLNQRPLEKKFFQQTISKCSFLERQSFFKPNLLSGSSAVLCVQLKNTEDLEGVKWKLGLACFCPGKMGFRSLGLRFGSLGMGKKLNWEWEKYFLTMASQDITYFLGSRNMKKLFKPRVRLGHISIQEADPGEGLRGLQPPL